MNRPKIENTPYAEWWQSVETVQMTILGLLRERAAGKSICPSEVARAVTSVGWRSLMPFVRDVAREMAVEGIVEIQQKRKRVSPDDEWRGPIRIVLADRNL